ncbi:MAG: leucine-rich repeat domain-containing protein [Bacilli bacterium]
MNSCFKRILPVIGILAGSSAVFGTGFSLWVFNENKEAVEASVNDIVVNPFHFYDGDGYYDADGNKTGSNIQFVNIIDTVNKTATITSAQLQYTYTSDNGQLELPSVYYKDGVAYKITGFGDGTNKNLGWTPDTSLTTLIIPDSYTSINDMALSTVAPSITKVVLGKGIKTIGNKAFYCCNTLTDINFPSNLESIGNDAFFQCTLNDVNLSTATSLKTIGACSFGEAKVKTVEFPNSLEEIQAYAFVQNNITLADLSNTQLAKLGTGTSSYGVKIGNSFSNNTGLTCYLPNTVTTCGYQIFNNDGGNVYVHFAEEETPSGFDSKWNSTDAGGANITIHYNWDGVTK